MNIEVNINSKSNRYRDKNDSGKNIIKGLPLLLIISFLGIFFTLRFVDGLKPISSVAGAFARRKVVYDTYTVSLSDSVSDDYQEKIKESISAVEYDGVKRFEVVESDADINISVGSSKDNSIFSERFIPVSHIYSLVQDVDLSDLSYYGVYIVGDKYKSYLEDILDMDVNVVQTASALTTKLGESDNYIGLVFFDELSPEVKILTVNGEYFFDNIEACLKISFVAELAEDVEEGDFILSVLEKNLYLDIGKEVFDEEILAKVNMTGVTAIARNLAIKMDSLENYDYPAEVLGDFLADADLTHTSNEVSFLDDCVANQGMRFCSNTKYLETLTRSGIDIVELTGNHNNDYGATANAESIEMYKDLGMRYFGGGLNADDAASILYEEVNGTTLAFVGYNYYDTMLGTGAIASASRAGANSYSVEKMESDISKARENADVVIVDFQFQECYSYPQSDVIYPICYKPLANPDQKGTFRKAVDFGADIVIGAQAHQPQTFEKYGDGIIFYGLGNLFFDQKRWIGTRQGLILSHYFYDGKYIQTRMTPIYMDADLQPDFATEEQGDLLFELLKEAR